MALAEPARFFKSLASGRACKRSPTPISRPSLIEQSLVGQERVRNCNSRGQSFAATAESTSRILVNEELVNTSVCPLRVRVYSPVDASQTLSVVS